MGDRIDDLATRVRAVEARMDQERASIDQRFDAVDAALVEQREYTEFAFEKLEHRFDGLERRFGGLEGEFAEVKVEVRAVSSGLGRVERKLDQFIDRLLPPPRADPPEQPT